MSGDDTKLILEHFDDKFTALIENVQTLIDRKLDPVKEDISEIKNDMKVIKAAMKATNQDVLDHERHITQLEAA